MRPEELRRLNFRHLHYFWVVAKESHLTRAAERLHVSQSAISSQIRNLEEALGHKLFERQGRKLRLTEVGTVVLGYAEGIFDLGAELLSTMSGKASHASEYLRIGAVATLSRNFQQQLLKPLLQQKDIRLILESASLGELLERLRIHKLDLILTNRPVTNTVDTQFNCRRVARQSVCLVGPPRKTKKRFCLQDELAALELILPGPSSDIRGQFELLCAELDAHPTIRADVDDMAMLRLLARDSGAIAVVPEIVVQDELELGVLQKYCELPGVDESFYAITADRHFRTPLLNQFIETGLAQ